MNPFDPIEIQLLRRMAQEPTLVPDMVRQTQQHRASTRIDPIDVLNSFRQAFALTLAQAKPITDWLAYGGGEKADADLHALVWPCIEANRGSWGAGGLAS